MRTRLKQGIGVAVVAALLLAGCGGGSDTSSGSGGSGSGGGSGGASADSPLDKNATLVFADAFQNDTIDPAKNDSGFPTRQLALVYDRLIGIDPEGGLEPQLATEWKFADDLTLDLTLRDDVTFQDGEAFDAAAVVANLERSMGMEEAKAAVKTPASAIESVTATDDHVVQIKLNRALYSLPFDLAQNLGMMISPASLDGSLDGTAVGAGMFKLVDFKPGVSATYERWDGYWDPDAVRVAGVEIRSVPNAQTRLNAVRSGQVSMAFIDENQVEEAEGAGLNVTTQANVSAWSIFLNLTRGDLDDARVRQAISMAIDRKALVETLAFGHGTPTVQLFPPGYYAYDDEVGPETLAYDPERAGELLDEAGVGDLKVSMLVLNRPLDKQVAQAIQQMLKDAGITMDLQVVEPARYSIFSDGEIDSFLGRWGGRADPADSLYSNAGADGFLNPGGGTTDEFEELMTKIAGTADVDNRNELIKEASGIFGREQLDIPIFGRESLFADNGCVVGFEPYKVGADEYRGVGIAADCN